MDLLIVSTSTARHMLRLWGYTDAPSDVSIIIFMITTIIFGVMTFAFLGELLFTFFGNPRRFCKQCHSKSFIETAVISILALICSGGIFDDSLHAKTARAENVGASLNVGCYHQLRHLRRLYPKAPCHKVVKPCKQSLSKAYSASQKKILTKHEILQKYKEFKKPYRKTRGKLKKINGSRSLHPRAPRWYEFF